MFKRLGAVLTLAFASLVWAETQQANLTVYTRTGTFIGGYNDTYPDVRHFKYIPYAKPPVGIRRWASPEALDDSTEVIDSTVFGPSCAQYVSAVPSVWAMNITGNLIVNYGESLLAGEFAQNSAEDCLTLAIWTPANATAGSKLPVIHFFTGGGDVTGGINIPTQIPANWVHRSQSHIVVTTNYRVNIFSNPHARGLHNHTNFAMQDQRVAIEWVAENIAAFGGDPSRITIWGQSAGSGMVDTYLSTYYDDPIAAGAIMSSAFAIGYPAMTADYDGLNFTFVAKSLGCDFSDPKVELECMRRITPARIENFVGQYQDNSSLVDTTQSAIKFTRQIDNKYVWTNYTKRHLEGKYAKIPTIFGTTAREFSALLPYQEDGPSEELITEDTLIFVCGGYNTTKLLNQANLTTYRYEWAGNFSNIAPVPWLGAYHYSDLYMFFGTYLIAPGEITDLEIQTAETMQDYFLEFISDPSSMSNKWPAYDVYAANGGNITQFGADGKAVQIVTGDSVEGACHIPGATYYTTP
ncbi:carboxylesterase [Lentinula raphanica]|nr:carboxylesterase [Lentinula raphanica]